MKELRAEVDRFVADVLGTWKPLPGLSAESVQRRFVYAQCVSARESAASYWILRDADRIHDAHILARNLLERFFLSRLAAREANQAAALICAELEERKKRLLAWPIESEVVRLQVEQMVAEQDSELAIFRPIAGSTVAPQNVYERAEKVGATAVYRTLYWHLCRFSHPSYDTSRPEERDRLIPKADLVALLSPLDVAWQLHMVLDGRTPCEIDQRYDDIGARLRNAVRDERGEPGATDNLDYA